MPFYTDHLGRAVAIPSVPKRIISVVPSQTELLFDLGLEEEVIGITKFCIHPRQWFTTRTRVGGTKKLHLHTIRRLQPDLVIANKEENTREDIEALAQEFPVWVSDINTLEDALHMIRDIGAITGKENKAAGIIASIVGSFENHLPSCMIPAAYLIWKDPYMAAGGDTFINDMMQRAGFRNVLFHSIRYPVIQPQELLQTDCRLVLLSSEPYPFRQKHMEELQVILPGMNFLLADGEMFSWYGSRLLKAAPYFRQLHQQALSLTHAAGI